MYQEVKITHNSVLITLDILAHSLLDFFPHLDLWIKQNCDSTLVLSVFK